MVVWIGVQLGFRESLDRRVAADELDIPLFPEAARKVLDACESDDGDVRQLAEIVRRDPTLSAQFLRLANSPAFGARTAIVSLPQALTRLGTTQTRQIAWLVTCESGVFACNARRGAAQRLRLQSVATALWAQEIARLKRMNVEEAFLCGLLGNVAMPALWQLAADIETTATSKYLASEVDAQLERVHDAVGADIAHRWGLPTRVVSAIRHHHASAEAVAASGAGPSLAGVVTAVQLADSLASAVIDGDATDLAGLQAHPSIAALSLYGQELDDLLARREIVLEAMRATS